MPKHVMGRNEAISLGQVGDCQCLVRNGSGRSASVDVTFFAVVCFFQGAQDGYAALLSKKKVTKENSRLRLIL